jgi:hypothetical protein
LLLNFITSDTGQTQSGTMTFVVTTSNPAIGGGVNLGTAVQEGSYTAYYTAPPSISQSFDVQITATDSADAAVTTTACTVKLLQDGDLGIGDDGHTQGIVGNVYHVPAGQPVLLNPATLTIAGTLLTPNLNVPDHDWSDGFPGLDASFVEWFEIDFNGQIYFPEDGDYQFRTDADDGAILFIAGAQVDNNDGTHPVTTVIGPVKHYSKGWYTFEEWYYQGPRYRIANMVYWRSASNPLAGNWSIIPPESLARPNTNQTVN